MRAAVVEAPGRLVVRDDLPEPRLAGDYDVLVTLVYGTTCTATDRLLLEGRFPRPVPYPLLLGHESVGRVTAVGARVRSFSPGDLLVRVGAPDADGGNDWGGFAEKGWTRDAEAMREDGLPRAAWAPFDAARRVLPDVPPVRAPLLVTLRETLSFLTRTGLRRGVSLLLVGSGGHALAFAHHAARLGARCVAVGSAGRRDLALAAGAEELLDYRAADLEERLALSFPIALDETGAPWLSSGGCDLLLDAAGSAETVRRLLPTLAPGGTVALYGTRPPGEAGLDPMRARGTFTVYNAHLDEAEVHDEAVDAIRSGGFDPSIWLGDGHAFPLAELPRAFDELAARRRVKALVHLGGE